MEHRTPPVRLLWLAVAVTLWMGAVLGRLSYLQLFRYPEYLARAQRQQQRLVEVSPRRGVVYDRNLRELAMSVSVESCFAVPSEVIDPEMVARLLSGILHLGPEEIETRLRSSRSFVWLARKLPPEMVERIQALNLRGIYFQKENQRFYPKRQLAAQVLGYVDIDERGLGGIEYALDEQIRGPQGHMLILADARRRWYDRSQTGSDAGASVILTIDEKLQYIAEKELARALAETHAQAGSVVLQDPNTGELLALADWPTFNPNAPAESPPESRVNRAVAALYEPGSTFKVVPVAAALEEDLARPEEVIDCQMGAIYIAGHRIRDHKPFGLLSVAQVIAKSSDVGAIKLGLRLGAPKLYDYIRAFGFGQPTGIELPGESSGLLRRPESWTAVSVGSIAMGQEVGVTAVQLVTAFSAIANGGMLYRPRIVGALRRGGQLIASPAPQPRRVVSPRTAASLRRMFEEVVLEGTGTLARLDGYTAAGKTGTAQKIDPATGRYSRTQFIASFVGFAPVNNPALTVLVTLDSPAGGHHGGEVAAPVFKRIGEQALAYLNVPNDVMVTPATRMAARRRNKREPPPDVTDFAENRLEARRSSLRVFPSERRVAPAGEGEVTLALVEGEGMAVPSFAGRSVRSVTEECLRLGLSPVLVGTGVAVEQSPEPGARVRRGSRITVRFARSLALGNVSRRGG